MHLKKLSHLVFILCLLLTQNISHLYSEEVPKFIRLARNEKKIPISLDAAIVSYQRKGARVDLVSAVHVGEASYYDELNKIFNSYDAVLYELIAPEGTKVELGSSRKEENLVSSLQLGLKNLLALEFQLEKVDYSKKNFVHADMTPEDFSASMKKRGESVWGMIFKLLLRSHEIQSKYPQQSPEFIILQMLAYPNQKFTFKRFLAEQFQDVSILTEMLEGPDGSTILSERNKVVLKVLQREIAAGKKNIAIFYGAGHMPDIHKRLINDHGFSLGESKWVEAWRLE